MNSLDGWPICPRSIGFKDYPAFSQRKILFIQFIYNMCYNSGSRQRELDNISAVGRSLFDLSISHNIVLIHLRTSCSVKGKEIV